MMPSSLSAAAVAGALAIALTSCSSFQVRGPGERTVDSPVPVPEAGGVAGGRSLDSPMVDQRQACRAGAIPRGWIAIRYLRLPRECPETEDEGGYNGILLQYFADRARGTEMEICADQTTPSGWVGAGDPAKGVCEGARVEEGEPTMRVIRRAR